MITPLQHSPPKSYLSCTPNSLVHNNTQTTKLNSFSSNNHPSPTTSNLKPYKIPLILIGTFSPSPPPIISPQRKKPISSVALMKSVHKVTTCMTYPMSAPHQFDATDVPYFTIHHPANNKSFPIKHPWWHWSTKC